MVLTQLRIGETARIMAIEVGWGLRQKLFLSSCGGECGGCGSHVDTHTIEPSTKNEGHESKEVMT
ncbi:MAG: hypothetical protein DDT25_00468 [Chloroflexi bacterium]|nr:hypothetical protein [Chloroflexota bacterium]